MNRQYITAQIAQKVGKSGIPIDHIIANRARIIAFVGLEQWQFGNKVELRTVSQNFSDKTPKKRRYLHHLP